MDMGRVMFLMSVDAMLDGVDLHVLFQSVTIFYKTKHPQCVVDMVSVMHQMFADVIQVGKVQSVPFLCVSIF